MQQPYEPCDFDQIAGEELPQAWRIAEYFESTHPLDEILDVGCGPGIYVLEMRKRGLHAFGCDSDPRLPTGDWFFRRDFTVDGSLSFKADVVLSLEVAEHLPETSANHFIRLIQLSKAHTLYFSAARPGQGGIGHINCQPKAYWVERFHDRGYWLDPDETDRWLSFMRAGPHMGWLTQNGLVLRRKGKNGGVQNLDLLNPRNG